MIRVLRTAFWLALVFGTSAHVAAQGTTCGSAPFDAAPAPVAELVRRMDPALDAFDSLRAALDTPGLTLCLTRPLFDARGYLEPETLHIYVDSTLTDGLKMAILAHELRHLQQVSNGTCPTPDLSMRAHADAVFAMEADASVTAAVVAWHLSRQGQPEMWQALADWPMQTDIAAAFAAEMARTDDPAQAAAVAFDQWYAQPDRVEAYDRAACWDYLDAQDESHRLPTYGALDPGYFDRLCRLPDATAYDCADPRD